MPGLQGELYVSCPLRKDTLASVSRIMIGNLQRLGLLSPYEKKISMMVRAIFLNPPTICTSVNLAEHSCVPAVHLNYCQRNNLLFYNFFRRNVTFSQDLRGGRFQANPKSIH